MNSLLPNYLLPERSLLVPASSITKERRSVYEVTRPLLRWAEDSTHFFSAPLGAYPLDGIPYNVPRFVFIGPKGGGDYVRLAVFAGIHGDETGGPFALVDWVQGLLRNPELARGYEIFLYPVTNPSGFEDGTRFARSGKDLNRQFWQNSREPEVQLLEAQLLALHFHGIVSLHSDNTSHGVYGYARGATLTKGVLEPALSAAEQIFPRNRAALIDEQQARNGIISSAKKGMLMAPPNIRPRPFEIIFETPQLAPLALQKAAFGLALNSILKEYRTLISEAQNI
jgi:murein peptide amidase A